MTPSPGETARARVVIAGRVQGVWFRASTLKEAQRLRLGGWVRNLDGGEVEAAFEGPRGLVEAAISWCRTGPPSARVDSCDVTWEPPEGEGPFAIRHG